MSCASTRPASVSPHGDGGTGRSSTDKAVQQAADTVAGIASGSSVAVGGLGLCDIPSVLMEHEPEDGSYKIVEECTLPQPGLRVAHRMITDLAVIDVTARGLVLVELAPGVTEDEVRAKTEAVCWVDTAEVHRDCEGQPACERRSEQADEGVWAACRARGDGQR